MRLPSFTLEDTNMPVNTLTISEAALKIDRESVSWSSPYSSAAIVSFAFRATPPTYNNAAHDEKATYSAFVATQIDAATLALALWSDAANISFTRVGSGSSGATALSDNASILFGDYTNSKDNAAGFATYPSPSG